ncbi:MAG: FliI/YscN family ATPase [Sedimentisphaerales bacterium]|nr:FliI/YscN family ATPase [Sedimentisphaerales bacterium]
MAALEANNNWDKRQATVGRAQTLAVTGRVTGLTGLTVEVEGFCAPISAQCEIRTRTGNVIPAELIGFHGSAAVLMPLADMIGIASGDPVFCVESHPAVAVGPELLGRVINGRGEPIDGCGPLLCQTKSPLIAERLQPLARARINTQIGTGIRAVDALMACGRGQRMGIFSGPGVGKSVLLGMISRFTSADVSVIALVGERGREVREFIEKELGPDGLSHSVVVVSTSDDPAPLRIHAALLATTIAEFFRDAGKDVLLLMDSITRIAMAQRQIGLALGEPPATKGYTPSVFALLPSLVERCGKAQSGSITGFYTILVEGDDLSEPIADAMRGLLDGHLWLSRNLANRGHYPAIDILESISRVMPDIANDQQALWAREITRLIAVYRDIEDLVNIGAYSPGSNAEFDMAVQAHGLIDDFLQQGMAEKVTAQQAIDALRNLIQKISQQSQGSQRRVSTEAQAAAKQKKEAKQKTKDNQSAGLERMMAGL